MENIEYSRNKPYLLRYGQYVCRDWNRTHPPQQHVQTFEIVAVREITTAFGPTLPKPVTLWYHNCMEPGKPGK